MTEEDMQFLSCLRDRKWKLVCMWDLCGEEETQEGNSSPLALTQDRLGKGTAVQL